VVVAEGCTSADGTGCPEDRGMLFSPNASSTWDQFGLYELSIYEERFLGYSGNGLYGNDTVTLGWPGATTPAMPGQVVTGIATKDFYLGTLPLSRLPTNLTTLNNPIPSVLQQLKTGGHIPSLSWGYTAGGYGLQPQYFGSLALGGYDQSQFESSNVWIPMGADQSRDLLPAIQSIRTNTSDTELMPTARYALIDSLVSHIWLPTAACTAFEQAFNLTYDNDTELYLVDEALHNDLLASNPLVTITLGAELSGGDTVSIDMPYWAFDLQGVPPFLDNTSYYFPLRRAPNDSTITLGRAFLQSAYVIANYENNTFSVNRPTYPNTIVGQQNVPIYPGGLRQTAGGDDGSTLGGGAIAGIVIGAVAAIALIALAGWFVFRKKRRSTSPPEPEKPPPAEGTDTAGLGFKQELDATEPSVAALNKKSGPYKDIAEVDGSENFRSEMDATQKPPAEIDGYETKTSGAGRQSGVYFEMPANEPVMPAELESPATSNHPSPMHTPVRNTAATPTTPSDHRTLSPLSRSGHDDLSSGDNTMSSAIASTYGSSSRGAPSSTGSQQERNPLLAGRAVSPTNDRTQATRPGNVRKFSWEGS